MKIVGYSERGILNALLYEIRYAADNDALLNKLMGEAKFPFTDDKPAFDNATVYVEQSLSEFGDADAIALIESNGEKGVVFIEAKVGAKYNLCEEFKNFEVGAKLPVMPRNSLIRSNIFTQLFYKKKLVFHNICETNKSAPFPKAFLTQAQQEKKSETREIGNVCTVLAVANEIKHHNKNAYYLVLLPDNGQVADFFDAQLQPTQPPPVDVDGNSIDAWDTTHYGYLTWQRVHQFCEDNGLKDTLDVFDHNKDKIY